MIVKNQLHIYLYYYDTHIQLYYCVYNIGLQFSQYNNVYQYVIAKVINPAVIYNIQSIIMYVASGLVKSDY